jgi:integrase
MRGNPQNHPKPGSSIVVSPIRNREDIEIIKIMLVKNPRNYALFIIGINSNLRGGDIVKLKVRDVRHLKPGDDLRIIEQKTGKTRIMPINTAIHEAIRDLLNSQTYDDDEYLFRGQQRGSHISVAYLGALVKGWCKAAGVNSGNYCSHTLRKTWGFHARKHGVDIPTLMTCFNHSSQQQTLQYLGVSSEEVRDVFLSFTL